MHGETTAVRVGVGDDLAARTAGEPPSESEPEARTARVGRAGFAADARLKDSRRFVDRDAGPVVGDGDGYVWPIPYQPYGDLIAAVAERIVEQWMDDPLNQVRLDRDSGFTIWETHAHVSSAPLGFVTDAFNGQDHAVAGVCRYPVCGCAVTGSGVQSLDGPSHLLCVTYHRA